MGLKLNKIVPLSMKRILYQLRRQLNKNEGFSLIEIMIVIAIIAILVGLLVPGIIDKPDKAKVQLTKAKMSQLDLPLLEYSSLKGGYPSTEEGLAALVTEGVAQEKQIKDLWGNPYIYRYPAENEGNTYEIISYGADGKEGGTGVNADIYSWEKEK